MNGNLSYDELSKSAKGQALTELRDLVDEDTGPQTDRDLRGSARAHFRWLADGHIDDDATFGPALRSVAETLAYFEGEAEHC
jgi:hypothetical protein